MDDNTSQCIMGVLDYKVPHPFVKSKKLVKGSQLDAFCPFVFTVSLNLNSDILKETLLFSIRVKE